MKNEPTNKAIRPLLPGEALRNAKDEQAHTKLSQDTAAVVVNLLGKVEQQADRLEVHEERLDRQLDIVETLQTRQDAQSTRLDCQSTAMHHLMLRMEKLEAFIRGAKQATPSELREHTHQFVKSEPTGYGPKALAAARALEAKGYILQSDVATVAKLIEDAYVPF